MPSTKKKVVRKAPTKARKKQEESPFIVQITPAEQKARVAKEVAPVFSLTNRHINPLNPKSRDIVQRIVKSANIATLSIQAQKSTFRDDLTQRIPRAETEAHMQIIQKMAPTAILAGSYRRGAAYSGDIDIIVTEPLDAVLARMKAVGYIKHTFSAGPQKFSGVVRHPEGGLHRHLDIIATTPESLIYALLYFTGSHKFNVIMRLRAKRLGLKLNEYGLFDTKLNQVPGIKSEKDVFTALNFPYKEPSER